MPLQVTCTACNAKLRAPDTAAGKKTKCPKCQAVIAVPIDAPQAPAASSGMRKVENWHMQTTDGSQFGPVPRSELDEWFKEGRISADCQLLKEGSDQWQWASEIYPSLEQPSPTAAPNKPAFEFLGPATNASNDPLGLGNAALGMSLPAPTPFPYQAPAPSYGGGYGAPANPYSSPSTMSYGSNYGSQARSGLHPMVIISAIIEFLYGGLFAIATLGFAMMMIALLLGGAAVAASAQDNPNAQDAGPAIASLTGMGMLCLLPAVLLCLGLSVLMISSGVGLLRRRFWAKIVSIVWSVLYLLFLCISLVLALMSLDPCSLLVGLVNIALNATILTAMLLPDCTRDFS